jgi:histidinol-phosphate aminotransferase
MKELSKRLNSGILKIKPYEPGKTVYEAQAGHEVTDFIKLASNENPFGMSPKALQAIRERAGEGFAYPEVSCREVRLALAGKLGIDAEQIIVGNGGDGIIYACAMSMIDEGDEAIIPEITFPYYEIAVQAMRGRVVTSRMKGFELDLDDIINKIGKKTKMIWLCNPNNPTGSVVGRTAFAEFLKKIPDDIFVIHDEVYADFAVACDFPDALALIKAGKENLFIIRSFSKIYGLAGVRVGFGAGSKELVRMMYRVRPPFDVSVLAQIATVAALGDDEFYRHTLEHNEREKKYLYQELGKRLLPYAPTATNFILIDVAADCRAIAQALLERGVIVRPAANYHLPRHIRLTIGTHEQNERFLKALDEVKRS